MCNTAYDFHNTSVYGGTQIARMMSLQLDEDVMKYWNVSFYGVMCNGFSFNVLAARCVINKCCGWHARLSAWTGSEV